MSGHTYIHTCIHTHRTTTVTLAAHAHRGLIIDLLSVKQTNNLQSANLLINSNKSVQVPQHQLDISGSMKKPLEYQYIGHAVYFVQNPPGAV